MTTQLRLLLTLPLAVATASSLAAQGGRGTGPSRDTSDVIGRPGALTAIEAGVLNSMTDPNIVAHLIFVDSVEAALAVPISQIVHDTTVASLGRTLATDHAHALELDRALIPGLRGLPRLSAGDTTDPRMLRTMELRFRGIGPDSALDRTFVAAEVVHHVHLLNVLGALRARAKGPSVQQRIDNEMEIERAHLARAQAIAHRLGVPSPSP